jgi:4-amino-4-deoxy-L-arabinose transferase-like glycosyltransferase
MNKTDERSAAVYYIFILAISALFFIPFLGKVHLFDWDEINFAESAREMISSHDYLSVQINYIPFYEKPPLFIWMQVVSMKAFGINEFAARFPNALCGILTLMLLFSIGSKLADKRFGLIWALLFGGSVLPFLYFKSGIIDPWFNLFIFLGIYRFYLFSFSENNRIFHLILSALFIGLAILTKGPVALLIFMLTAVIYLIIGKFKIKISIREIFIYFLVLTIAGGFWFILQILRGNFGIIADFIEYQIRLFRTHGAGHSGFLLYHFVVLLIGVFPASLLALPALFGSKTESGSRKEFLLWMLILFWVVLILFTIVKTKIVHYSSMCYFPLTFISAWWVYHSGSASNLWKKIIKGLIIVIGLFLAMVVAILTCIDLFKETIISRNLIHDPFAVACLGVDAGWHGYESLASLALIAGVILFVHYWNRNIFKAVYMLTGMVSVFLFISMYVISPRIEIYSQRAALEFFESVSNQDAYVVTLGYKSYAQLFYGKAKNHENPKSKDEEWLLSGDIDKPVMIAAKSYNKEKFLSQYPDMELLYEKNGFAFFKRNPKPGP